MEQALSPRERRTVVLVDDHPLRSAAVAAWLARWAERSGADVIAATATPDPEVLRAASIVIVNVGALRLAEPEGHEIAGRVMSATAGAAVVAVSDRSEPGEILAALRLGMRGFLPNGIAPGIALHALTFILNGGSFFPPAAVRGAPPAPATDRPTVPRPKRLSAASAEVSLGGRQFDVYDLLCAGARNREIAAILGVGEAEVKARVRQIIQKFGAANRTQAALSRRAKAVRRVDAD